MGNLDTGALGGGQDGGPLRDCHLLVVDVGGGYLTGGHGPDDGGLRLSVHRHGLGVVHGKALQPADVDGVVHHPPAALALAGVLADVGAGGDEGVVLADEAHRVLVPPLVDQGHIAGDVHMGGAGGHAGHRVTQPADAPAVEDVLLIVLPEASDPLEDHVGRLVADGAVGGVGDDLGGIFDEVDVLQRGGAVQHPLDEDGQLAQPHPAGDAFAAGLGVAQPQEVQGHVHRAQARLVGVEAPLHIPVQAIEHCLCAARSFDG